MADARDYDLLVHRLRAELLKAEEEFRLATTVESKIQSRDRYEHALDQYSELVLSHGKSKPFENST